MEDSRKSPSGQQADSIRAAMYDNIGSPRLRRLWGPISILPSSPTGQPTPRQPAARWLEHIHPEKSPTSKNLFDTHTPGSSRVVDVKYQATGSLLPQPQPFLTPRLGVERGSMGGGVGIGGGVLCSPKVPGVPGERVYNWSTIRRMHAVVLQSALDLTFGGALERVVTAAKTITNAHHAQIFFLEKSPVQPNGLNQNTTFRLRLKGRGTQDKVFPSEGLAGICAVENMPVVSNRPHHDARFNPDIDWAPGSGVKSVACAPMTNTNGKVVGVIQVSNKAHGGFTDDDIHFLDMLARQAAITFDLCVKNDLRQAQLRKTTSMLKGFIKLAGKSSAAELAHKSGLLCKEVCCASQAACFLMEDNSSGLTSWTKLSDGKADVYSENKVPLKGFLAELIKGGEVAREVDTEDESEDGVSGGGNKRITQHLGCLYCPIISNGIPIGILQARGSRKGQFSDVDEQMLKALGSMVAVIHDNISRVRVGSTCDQSGKPWPSAEAAVAEIEKTLIDGINAQKSAVLFVDRKSECFWTIDPKSPQEKLQYLRFPLESFPLSWVLKNKTVLSYPAADSPTQNSTAFKEKEVAGVKALCKKFLNTHIKLECMLACPLLASGECVAVLLVVNQQKTSGPFEPWVSKSIHSLSAKWGTRLELTLQQEGSNLALSRMGMLKTHVSDLLTQRPANHMFCSLSIFLAEYLQCNECLVLVCRKNNYDDLLCYSGSSDDALPVKASYAGCAAEVFKKESAIIFQDDDSWLSKKLNITISSAVAVPIRRSIAAQISISAKNTLSRELNQIIAVIVCVNKLGQVDKFSQVDADELEKLSDLTARIIENNRSLNAFQELQKEMENQTHMRNVILEGAATLHHNITPSAVLPRGLLSRTREMVKNVMRAADCNVFFSALGGEKMYAMQDDLAAHAFLEPIAGIAGHVITTGNTVLHSKDEQHPLFDASVDQRVVKITNSLVCVPILDMEGKVVGCIEVLNKSSNSDQPQTVFISSEPLKSKPPEAIMGDSKAKPQKRSKAKPPADANVDVQGDETAVKQNVYVKGDEATFKHEDAALLQQLVKHLNIAFINSTLFTKMTESSRQLTTISPEASPKESVQELGKFLQRICCAERVNMFVRDLERPGTGPFVALDDYSHAEIAIDEGQGFVGRCAASRNPLFVHHMTKEPLFNPSLDMREGMTILHALYVPIEDIQGQINVVVEVCNKTSGDFDGTDLMLAQLVGLHVFAVLNKAEDTRQLDESRTQALSLLTSVQYLYPFTGGTDDILHSAIGQLSIVLRATVRIFLTMFNEDGTKVDDLWKCYDNTSASPTIQAVNGCAGSSYRNVGTVRVASQDLRHVDNNQADGEFFTRDLEEGATQTSAFLCQPLMDSLNKRPIGVVEFRRAEKVGSSEPVDSFSDLEEELVYQVSILIVHSMVHHSKTWSVKATAEKLRAEGVGKTGVKFPD